MSEIVSSAAAFRAHFPALNHLAYFASCSLGARSRDVADALSHMIYQMDAVGTPWESFEGSLDNLRSSIARLLHVPAREIAVLPNASTAAYQIASGIDWSRRSTIVASCDEFPSLGHVWLAQERLGARVRFVDRVNDAAEAVEAYDRAIDGDTALVSVPAVTYERGQRLPVSTIAAIAHARGALVVTDAYQMLASEPTDASELGCDFLIAGASKYLAGLPGVAFLCAPGCNALHAMPTLTGWFGRQDPFAFNAQRLDWSTGAQRFETGTPPYVAIYAAEAAAKLIEQLDLSGVHATIRKLMANARGQLADMGERLALSNSADETGAHIALVEGNPARLASFLSDRDIVVAPRGELVRIAFHYYNSSDDIDRLCTAITEFRRGTHSLTVRPPSCVERVLE